MKYTFSQVAVAKHCAIQAERLATYIPEEYEVRLPVPALTIEVPGTPQTTPDGVGDGILHVDAEVVLLVDGVDVVVDLTGVDDDREVIVEDDFLEPQLP